MKKWYVWLPLTLLSLFIILIILAIFLFPKQRLLTEIETRASVIAKQPVKVGDLSLQFWPPMGLRLLKLSIGDASQADTLAIRVEEIVLKIKLTALLKKQLQLTHLSIIKPEIIMVQRAPTESAASTPTTPSKAPIPQPSPTSTDSKPYAVLLQSLSVHHGSLTVLTAKRQPLLVLAEIDEEMSASLDDKRKLTVAGKLKIAQIDLRVAGGSLGKGLNLELHKRFAYDLQNDSLTIEQGDLQLGDLPLKLTGTVNELQKERRQFDVKLQGGPSNIKSILGYLPSAVFPQVAGIQSSGELTINAYVKGRMPVDNLDYKLQLHLKNGKLVYPKLPQPVRDIQIHLEADPNNLLVHEFQATTGNNQLAVNGQINGYRQRANAALAIKANLNLKEIVGMQPNSVPVELDGRADINMQIDGPLKQLNKLRYRGFANLENVTIVVPDPKITVKNLTGKLTFNEQKVSFNPLRGQIQSSQFSILGEVSDYQKNPQANLTIDGKLVLSEIATLAKISTADIGGSVTVKVTARGPVKNPNKLDLSGLFTLTDVAYLAKQSDIPPLKNINGRLTLTRQNIGLQDLRGVLGSSDFSIKGSANNLQALYEKESADDVIKFDFALASQKLNLDELVPKKSSDEKADAVTIAGLLRRFDGKVAVRAQNVNFNKMQARDVHGTAYIRKGVFDLKDFQLQSFGGGIQLGGKADFTNVKAPSFDLGLQLQGLKLAELLAYSPQLNRYGNLAGFLSADLSTKMRLQGELDQALQLNLNKLNASGLFNLAKATMTNHPLQNNLANFLNAPQLKKLSLKDWQQDLSIQAGKLNIKNLKLDAGDFSAAMSGTQSIDGKLDMGLDLNLPASWKQTFSKLLPEQAANLLLDGSQGPITVPLSVGGVISSPSVSVNQQQLNVTVQKLVQSKLSNEKQKLQKQLQNNSKDLLKGQIKDQGQKVLDSIFK